MNAASKRPDSSVVEHFHGKEGVDSSILSRGSDQPNFWLVKLQHLVWVPAAG